MDKKTRDIKAINARLNILERQISENITEVSYGSLDTELAVGSIIYNISLSANLKGKIPKEERFILSFPDGSNPLIILNKKEDLETTVSTIPVYVDGTDTWEQLIYPSVTYPIGSLISAVNYASNDTNFAAGGNQEVQFNSEGQLGADSDFIYNTSTDTIEAPNATISGTITGDLTGNADTATKITSITNSNIVQLTDTQTLTNKTLTSPTLTTPVLGTPSSGDLSNCTFPTLNQDTTGNAATATALTAGNKTIDGDLDITGNITGDLVDATSTVSVALVTASGLITGSGGFQGNLSATSSLSDGVTATTQSVGDNTTKVATTEFVQANSGGTPGGSNNQVQFAYNGAFTADSDFSFNQFSNILDVATVRAENSAAGIYLSGGSQYMYLTPVDFRPTASSSSSGFISNDGARLGIISGQTYYALFQVPKGYKVNYVDLKGSANYSFYIYASSYSSGTQVYKATGTINTPLTLLSYQQLIGAAGDYFTIKVTPSGYGNYIYGCQIGLIKT